MPQEIPLSDTTSEATSRPLNILLLAAEVVPFAKTGGLADVTGSLPPAIRALGHDIRVAMPRYGRIRPARFGLQRLPGRIAVPLDHRRETAELMYTTLANQTPIYFVESARYFEREGIYMYPDDAERFIFFCRAALEGMRQVIGWQPDIVHCHDWHTALVPNWLKTVYAQDPFFADAASVYTIHSLGYRGIFGRRVLEIAGIAEYEFTASPQQMDAGQVVDFMVRGITFADVITTVSPTYAKEILTPEWGEHMDELLRSRQERLFGILNGIDTAEYDPARDPYLDTPFSIEQLDRRLVNKLALQREAGLRQDAQLPLIGYIGRLTDQKGLDLIVAIVEHLLRYAGAQFVLLGTGEQRYHEFFLDLARRYQDQVGVFLTFNTSLARRIYAGSDIFLMPSRFEPCGLGQMIAMRYGSVPVVRAVGGLADTVINYEPASDQGTGFLFDRYDPMLLYTTLVRAVETYRHSQVWRRLQIRAMQQDFSWAASARHYVDVYHRTRAFRREEALANRA